MPIVVLMVFEYHETKYSFHLQIFHFNRIIQVDNLWIKCLQQ
jgi:hypothetical protein